MRIWLALRAFWAVLVNRSVAEQVRLVLEGKTAAAGELRPSSPASTDEVAADAAPAARPKPALRPATAARSDALTLLATLQREARLIDLVQEPLAEYSDAQVGAAARDVLRGCAAALERMFALRPVIDQEEGSAVEVPPGYDPLKYKLVGNVSGEPPFRGTVAHHGWIATRCELPAWTGSAQAANVVAPLEVEIG